MFEKISGNINNYSNGKVISNVDMIGNNILDTDKKISCIGEENISKVENVRNSIIEGFKQNDENIEIQGIGKTLFGDKFVKGLKVSLNIGKKVGIWSFKNPVKALFASIIISSMGSNTYHTLFDESKGEMLAKIQMETQNNNPINEIEKINIIKTLSSNENILNNTNNNDKFSYSLFENGDGTYTFLGYGSIINQKEEIKKLVISKGIDWNKVKIVRSNTDELIYKKNLELSSKNPIKMKEFLSLLKEGGDGKDRDNNFRTIYKYNISKENLEKYKDQINEIKEFGNIELIEK